MPEYMETWWKNFRFRGERSEPRHTLPNTYHTTPTSIYLVFPGIPGIQSSSVPAAAQSSSSTGFNGVPFPRAATSYCFRIRFLCEGCHILAEPRALQARRISGRADALQAVPFA